MITESEDGLRRYITVCHSAVLKHSGPCQRRYILCHIHSTKFGTTSFSIQYKSTDEKRKDYSPQSKRDSFVPVLRKCELNFTQKARVSTAGPAHLISTVRSRPPLLLMFPLYIFSPTCPRQKLQIKSRTLLPRN